MTLKMPNAWSAPLRRVLTRQRRMFCRERIIADLKSVELNCAELGIDTKRRTINSLVKLINEKKAKK